MPAPPGGQAMQDEYLCVQSAWLAKDGVFAAYSDIALAKAMRQAAGANVWAATQPASSP